MLQGRGSFSMAIVVFIVVVLFLVGGSNAACSQGSCQVHDICTKDDDCASDLKCESCSSVGDLSYRCTRFSVTNPLSKVGNDLPFNKYSWLTTHNSYAILGEKSYTGAQRMTFYNQEDSVTDQLNNGVRGLMLDMYDYENDVWLCHSFGGSCYNITAFMPAVNTLKEITTFLAAHPSEIITIFIEDYVKAPKGLTNVFTAAGLMKYWFPVSRMPQNGEDWPTVSDMIAKNQRLIVFTSISSKEASEGIAYEWKYVVETQYGNPSLIAGSCMNRAESKSLNSRNQSLFLENYFPDNPSVPVACKSNSDGLSNITSVCYEAAGKRWANFLSVDFYKKSYGGGALQAVDRLNGQLTCGCADVTQCQLQANGTFGVCKTSSNSGSGTNTGSGGSFAESGASNVSAAPYIGLFLHLIYVALLILMS